MTATSTSSYQVGLAYHLDEYDPKSPSVVAILYSQKRVNLRVTLESDTPHISATAEDSVHSVHVVRLYGDYLVIAKVGDQFLNRSFPLNGKGTIWR